MKAAKAIDPTNPTTTASAIQGHGLFRPSPARPGAPGRGGSASARGGSTSSGEPIRGALSGPVASTVAADTGGAAAFVSGTPLAPTMPAANDATRAPAERGGGGGAGRGGTTGLAAPAPAPKAGAAARGAAPKAGAVATGAEPDGAAAAPLSPRVGAFSGAAGRGGVTCGREGATGLAGGGVGGAGGAAGAGEAAGAGGPAVAGEAAGCGSNSASSRFTATSSAFSSRAMSLSGSGGFSDRSCPIKALRARSYIARRAEAGLDLGKFETARDNSE